MKILINLTWDFLVFVGFFWQLQSMFVLLQQWGTAPRIMRREINGAECQSCCTTPLNVSRALSRGWARARLRSRHNPVLSPAIDPPEADKSACQLHSHRTAALKPKQKKSAYLLNGSHAALEKKFSHNASLETYFFRTTRCLRAKTSFFSSFSVPKVQRKTRRTRDKTRKDIPELPWNLKPVFIYFSSCENCCLFG